MEEQGFTAAVVHNRDIPPLADVLRVMQEIRLLEERRAWQRDRLFNITQHMSGNGGTNGGLPQGLDSAFAAISEIDAEHENRCREYVRRLREAESIINRIGSPSMQTFVLMKYVFQAPDVETRELLNMTRRRFDKARQAVEDAPDMASVRWAEPFIADGAGAAEGAEAAEKRGESGGNGTENAQKC